MLGNMAVHTSNQYVCLSVCLSVCLYVCMYVCMLYACVYLVCVCVCAYICTVLCVSSFICVYISIYIYTYIHIHTMYIGVVTSLHTCTSSSKCVCAGGQAGVGVRACRRACAMGIDIEICTMCVHSFEVAVHILGASTVGTP